MGVRSRVSCIAYTGISSIQHTRDHLRFLNLLLTPKSSTQNCEHAHFHIEDPSFPFGCVQSNVQRTNYKTPIKKECLHAFPIVNILAPRMFVVTRKARELRVLSQSKTGRGEQKIAKKPVKEENASFYRRNSASSCEQGTQIDFECRRGKLEIETGISPKQRTRISLYATNCRIFPIYLLLQWNSSILCS